MGLIYRELTEGTVSLVTLIEYADAPAEVRAVYDDIMRTRGVDWINNFWKALANDPAQLRRVWHTPAARKKGMTDAMLMELMSVVGLANETNRLANGLRIEVDARFKP
jgi:alkylhydroperoxidase family enzyme